MARNDTAAVAEGLHDPTYNREMAIALAIYGALLGAAVVAIKNLDDSPLRYPFALLPMVGFGFGIRAVARVLRRLDERERDLLLRTFAASFGATAAITYSYGFLEMVGAPHISMFAVWPLQAVMWMVSSLVIRLRSER